MNEKRYTFTGDASSFTSQLDQLKSKGKDTYESLIQGASKYSEISKDQLQYIKQIVAAKERSNKNDYLQTIQVSREIRDNSLTEIGDEIQQKKLRGSKADVYRKERTKEVLGEYKESIKNAREEYDEQKLQTQALREIPTTIQQAAKEQIIAAQRDGETLGTRIASLRDSEDPKDQITANILEEQDRKNRPTASEETQPNNNVLSDLLRFRYIDKGLNAARGLAQTRTGFDGLSQVTDVAATAGQGLVEGSIKAIGDFFLKGNNPLKKKIVDRIAEGLGQITGTSIGIGGDVLIRNVETQNEYLGNEAKLRAITGEKYGAPELSQYGLDFAQVQGVQQETSQRMGSQNLNRNTANIALLEKGFAIDRNSLYQLAEIQRNTGKSVLDTTGGLLGSGLVKDRALFNEALGKFTDFQKILLGSSTTVSDKATADILSIFNKVGGEFAFNDFRSSGNIQAINSSLSSPGSEGMKAMSYGILRDLNPNANFADIRVMQQQGLQTPQYLSQMMQKLEGLGGGEDFTRIALEGLGINASAAKTLYNNREKLYSGEIGEGDLKNIISGDRLRAEAGQSTTVLDQNTAAIKNAIVQGSVEGIMEMGERLADTITKIFAGTSIILKNGELQNAGGAMKSNQTKKP